MTLADAETSVRVLVTSPQFGRLVVTEINPDHADPDGLEMGRFVRALAAAICSA